MNTAVVMVVREVGMATLREARLAKFWTMRQLAQKAGVALSTIYYLETGQKAAHLATMQRIATALEIEPLAIVEFRKSWERNLEGKDAA